jgi:SAM-dependent methyltransferase
MIYQQLAKVENEHWWHQSRLRLVKRILNPIDLSPNAQILDVGCGTGGTTRFLSRYGSVTGVDVAEVLAHVREQSPSVKFIAGDANHLTDAFPKESFDLITFFGVLCHEWIDSDIDVLQQAMQLLKPGGYILITEAAYRFLKRQHDIQAKAKRRYRIADFRKYFAITGLTYQVGRYFNAFSFPICLVLAAINKIFPHQDHPSQEIAELKVPPAWLNNTLKGIMGIEQTLYSWLPLPIGVSLLVLGRKPLS